MSDNSGDWRALASHNERLAKAADTQPETADVDPAYAVAARWSELASQRERYVPLPSPRPGTAGSVERPSVLRLAVKAA